MLPEMFIRMIAAGLVMSLLGTPAAAQPATRRATTVSALVAYPAFFHGQIVILRGEFTMVGESRRFRAVDGEESIQAVGKGEGTSGPVEVRGEYWDTGRLAQDDPRLSSEARAAIEKQFGDRWPKPGEAPVLNVSVVQPAAPPPAPTLRTIALEPGRYREQRVTITGQFRGRNLYGDLPQAPGVSKWDFVLKSADASIWIANLQPKTKDLNLDVLARVDTGRWVEVSGVVKSAKGLTWIEAQRGTLMVAKAVADEPAPEEPAPPRVEPPVEVIFSAPTEGEVDVVMSTSVRLQFSRDLDPSTIKGQVHASYQRQESVDRGELQPPPIELTTEWVAANRMLLIKFTRPLERFRTLKLELGEGIKARDGAPLKPFTLTFGVGGS
jgi:Bacterial Ig-like domain